MNLLTKIQFLTVLFCLILISDSFSQSCVESIDKDRIIQKRKKKFIKNKYLSGISSFEDLQPTCYNPKDSLSYNYQFHSYILKDNIDKVWRSYKTLGLSDTYAGHIVSFGFIYSKTKKQIIYIDSDNYKGMKEGQIFFINLDLLGGLKKLVVAYEVTKIDENNKTIQFCYINNGVSQGTQRIILSETENGFTRIQHNTIFKSDSKLRDKFLYRPFHKLIVKELHKNLEVSL